MDDASLLRWTDAVSRVADAYPVDSTERRELARAAGLFVHLAQTREILRSMKLLRATDPSPDLLVLAEEKLLERFRNLPDELFLPELASAFDEPPAENLPARTPPPSLEAAPFTSMEGLLDPLPQSPAAIREASDRFDAIAAKLSEPSEEREALRRMASVYLLACRVPELRALIETEWETLRQIDEHGYTDEQKAELRRRGIDPETGEMEGD